MGPMGVTMALMLKLTALSLLASISGGGAQGGGLAFDGVLERLRLVVSEQAIVLVQLLLLKPLNQEARGEVPRARKRITADPIGADAFIRKVGSERLQSEVKWLIVTKDFHYCF